MRLIYLDESGISAKETVTVVAGVIINADQQWKPVAHHVRGLIEKYVPEQYQEGFVFHGKDLFHGSGRTPFDRRYYPPDQAHWILKQLLHVPGKFRLPVVFGYCNKRPLAEFFKRHKPRRTAAFHHAYTFSLCAVAAEKYMREMAEPSEVALMTAENNEDTRKEVKSIQAVLRATNPESFKLLSLAADISPGFLPITKIIDGVQFASKEDAPLLQIADVCAFIIRYFFEQRQNVKEFCDVLTANSAQSLAPAEGNFAGSKILTFVDKPDSLA